MEKENLATKRKPRRMNVNGTRNVLTVTGKDPAYEYRVVNDDGDRISQFEEMGYEIVKDQNIRVGDRRINNPTKEGSPIQASVGGGMKAYVMRIKRDWYEEDQAAKAAKIDETEKGMVREAREKSDYGKITLSKD